MNEEASKILTLSSEKNPKIDKHLSNWGCWNKCTKNQNTGWCDRAIEYDDQNHLFYSAGSIYLPEKNIFVLLWTRISCHLPDTHPMLILKFGS